MDPTAANPGPDPVRILTLDDLSRELTLLRSRAARGTRSARVSLEELATRVGEPKSTIHAYITGKRLPPTQILDRIVIALGTTPAEQSEWADAWYRVDAHREATHRVPASTPDRPPVPRQLPAPVETFTGRVSELHLLDRLLACGPSTTITAITGTAGVGKTALAVQWAQTRSRRFPDGQLYLDLRGYDPGQPMEPTDALARMLRVLGVAPGEVPPEPDERAGLYRSLLSDRQMLILLDNARDTEQLRNLLPGTSSCTVLATSRDRLTGLVVRHGARNVVLDPLAAPDAIDLLRALIDDTGADPTDGDLDRLSAECAGLPLALRIAAELTAGRSGSRLADVIRGLDGQPEELDLLTAGDDPRTALRAVFAWSYDLLPAEAARTFRFVGLHPGADLTVEAVAALTATSPSTAQRLLNQLAHAHLIRPGRGARYAMHCLLRAYAMELNAAQDSEAERWAATERLQDHYLSTGALAVDLVSARSPRPVEQTTAARWRSTIPDRASAHRWLDAERANLALITERARTNERTAAFTQLADAIDDYLDDRQAPVDLDSKRARLVGC